MDPDVGMAALWTLESVAEYVLPSESICILIQTSVCLEEISATSKNATTVPSSKSVFSSQAYQRKAQRIEQEAQPQFRDLIHRGNVRMTVLDYSFYRLKSCRNFYNPSFAWQNWHYWGPREFTREDSDLVLTIQDDAVLCRPLDILRWQDSAWVGAAWPASQGKKQWNLCSAMPANWYSFHARTNNTPPPYPSPDQLCKDHHIGPQGNGGVSLRRRSWLLKAIEYCPTDAAGINTSSAVCKAVNTPAEDVYFVTILRGMGAPLVSAYEAALFVWESRSIAQIEEQYQIENSTWKQERLMQRWSSSNVTLSVHPQVPVVPIGIHKPWSTFFKDLMCHEEIHRQCKYLRSVLHHSKYGRIALLRRSAKGISEPC
jgi:hypothetical protein